jgi:hypothetical protein
MREHLRLTRLCRWTCGTGSRHAGRGWRGWDIVIGHATSYSTGTLLHHQHHTHRSIREHHIPLIAEPPNQPHKRPISEGDRDCESPQRCESQNGPRPHMSWYEEPPCTDDGDEKTWSVRERGGVRGEDGVGYVIVCLIQVSYIRKHHLQL